MNGQLIDAERSSWELILFAIASLGVLMGLIGVILSSIPIAIFGLLFLAMGVGGFLVRQAVGE